MKKKGLIIATIVMVLVLAVSLTTATYAWFTVASVTKVDGFDVSVKPGTDVNIGVKLNNTYEEGALEGKFAYGAVAYAPSTAGTIGGGTWTGGTEGLGAEVTHGIEWGTQSVAVGITTGTFGIEGATASPANTDFWTGTPAEGAKVMAANGDNLASIDAENAYAAVANVDYAYLFLGVQPTKTLTTNELVILLNADEFTGANVGILSAYHVAYRLNSKGAWTNVELCGDSIHYNTSMDDFGLALGEKQTLIANAYAEAYRVDANTPGVLPTKGAAVSIPLSGEAGHIDQIEIVIYLAGEDEDCLNGALNGAKGSIEIFFATVPQE